MRQVLLCALLEVCLLAGLAPASSHPGAGAIYERVICVVPMVGAGTLDDPKRPLFAPTAGTTESSVPPSKGFLHPADIIAFKSVMSDDGQTAIVVFVARDRAALRPLLQSEQVLKKFHPSEGKPDKLLQELRKFKKDFELSELEVGAL